MTDVLKLMLNAECLLSSHPVNQGATVEQGRPQIDSEITSHEGFDNVELASMLELQAAVLDTKGYHGIAMDVRAGAERLRKLAEGK